MYELSLYFKLFLGHVCEKDSVLICLPPMLTAMATISHPQEFISISVECHNLWIVFVLHFLAFLALFAIFRSLDVLSEGLLEVRRHNFLPVFSLVTSFHLFHDSHISRVPPSCCQTLESWHSLGISALLCIASGVNFVSISSILAYSCVFTHKASLD
jgi:hypothetical protein